MRKIRFGVIGTNNISDWVIAGGRQDERFELVAVCSRAQERADEFAAKHNIPHTFTSLEEMAKSPLIDAVYIGFLSFLFIFDFFAGKVKVRKLYIWFLRNCSGVIP